MPFQFRIAWLVVGISLSSTFLSAAQVYEVKGVIRGSLIDGRPVIEHEEIPGYMPAMTMAFNVSDLAAVADLKEGDRVQFLFHADGKSSYADQFKVIGKELSQLSHVLSDGIAALKEGDPIPTFQLINEQGDPLTEADLQGRFTLITFIFTRCPVPEFCPLLATKFLQVQAALKEEAKLADQVRLLGVTLDPVFDTPEILQSYSKRVGADPMVWGFATGEPEAIGTIARSFDVISSGTGVSLNHTLTTALISPDGRVAKLWPGNRWQAEEVMEAISSACCSTSCCAEVDSE